MTTPGPGDTAPSPRPLRSAADVELDRLRDEFPAWRVWYVHSAIGGGTWCAQPQPLLNCGTPGQLRMSICRADQRRLRELTQPEGQPGSTG